MAATVHDPPPPPPVHSHVPLPGGAVSPAIVPPPPDPDQETNVSYASISAEEKEVFYRKYGMYKEWAKQVANDGALRAPESRPGKDVGAVSAIWDSAPTLKTGSSDVSGLQEPRKPQMRVSSNGRLVADDGSKKSPIPPWERLSIPIKSPLTGDSRPPEPVLARPPTRKPSHVLSDKAIPPAPGDLLTPTPTPGSTRAQRDAYLASATYLPLEMLSEVEPPRPPSDVSSQLSGSRLASLLSLRVKSPNISATGKSDATTIKAGKTVRSASDPVYSTVANGNKRNCKPRTSSRIASTARGRVAQSTVSPRLVPLPHTSNATLSRDVLERLPAPDADASKKILSSLASPRPDQAIDLKSNKSGLPSISALGLTVVPPTEQQEVRAEAGTEIGNLRSQHSQTPLGVTQEEGRTSVLETRTDEARDIVRKLGSSSSRVPQDPISVALPPSTAVEQTVRSAGASTPQRPSQRQSPDLTAPEARSTGSIRPSAVPERVPLPPTADSEDHPQNVQAQRTNAQSKLSPTPSPSHQQNHPSLQKSTSQTVQQDHSTTHRQQLPLPRPALSKTLSGLSGSGKTLGRRHRDPSSANLTAHFEPATYPLPPSGSASETVVVSPPITDKSLTLVPPPTPVSLIHSSPIAEVSKPSGHFAESQSALPKALGPQGSPTRSVAAAASSDSRHAQVPTLSNTLPNDGGVGHVQGSSRSYLDRTRQSSESLASRRPQPPAMGVSQRQPVIDRSAPQHPTIVIPAPPGEDYADHLSFEVPSGSRGRLRVSLAWFRDGARTERRARSRAGQASVQQDLPPPVPPKSPQTVSSRLRDHQSPHEGQKAHESESHPPLSPHSFSNQPRVNDRVPGPYRPPPHLDERRVDDRAELHNRLSPPPIDVPGHGWAASPILPYAPPHPFHPPLPGVNNLAYPQPPIRPPMFGTWPMTSLVAPAIPAAPFPSSQPPRSRAPPSPPRPPSIEPPSSRGSPLRPLPGLPFMPGPLGPAYPPADPHSSLQNPWGMGLQPSGRQQRGGIWSQFFGGRKTYGEGHDPGDDAGLSRWRTGVPPQQEPPPARTYAPTLARTIFTTTRDKRTRQTDSRWDDILPKRARGGWYDRPPRTPPAPLPPLPSLNPRLPNTTRNPFRSRRMDVSFDPLTAERQREKEERRRAKADRRNRREALSRDTSGDTPEDSRRRDGLGGFVPWTALGPVMNGAADGRKRGFNLGGNGRERQPDTGRQYAPKPDRTVRGRSGDRIRGWVDSIRPAARKQGPNGQLNRSNQGPSRRDARVTPRGREDSGKEELRGLMDRSGLSRKLSSKKWSDRARGMPRR